MIDIFIDIKKWILILTQATKLATSLYREVYTYIYIINWHYHINLVRIESNHGSDTILRSKFLILIQFYKTSM